MLQAHYRARDKKAQYWEILRFEMNLENNIVNLINSIRNGTYKIGDYRSFIVKEPKVREIQALPYRDRLKAQATMNSWFAHASHCNSYKLQQNIIKKSKFIFSQYTKIEP